MALSGQSAGLLLAIGSSDHHLVGTASVPRLPSGQVVETYTSPLPLRTMCPPPVGLRGGWGGGEVKRCLLYMADISQTPRSPDPDRTMDIDIPTLQPYLPAGGQETGRRESFKEQGTALSRRVPLFLDIQFAKSLEDISIFQIYRDLKKCCQTFKKIRQTKENTLLVQVANECQAKKVLGLRKIAGVDISISANRYLNQVRGVIFNRKLLRYSEEVLQKELEDQGVIEVKRIKRKEGSTLVDTPMLILTFDKEQLPDKIMAAWYAMDVRLYQPAPRRCYNCQKFGHLGSNCHSKQSICIKCSQVKLEVHTCSRTRCANCSESHQASDKNCEFYKMEKEVLSIQSSDKLSYPEARKLVYHRYNKTPGRTWAKTVQMTPQQHRQTKPLGTSVSPKAPVQKPKAPERKRQAQENPTVPPRRSNSLEKLPQTPSTPAPKSKEQRSPRVTRERRHSAALSDQGFKGFTRQDRAKALSLGKLPRAPSASTPQSEEKGESRRGGDNSRDRAKTRSLGDLRAKGKTSATAGVELMVRARSSRSGTIPKSSSEREPEPGTSVSSEAEGGEPRLAEDEGKDLRNSEGVRGAGVQAPSPIPDTAEGSLPDGGHQDSLAAEMEDVSESTSRKRERAGTPPQSPKGKLQKQVSGTTSTS